MEIIVLIAILQYATGKLLCITFQSFSPGNPKRGFSISQVMASSSTQPSLSDVPSHYLPIPSAQDESSWRTYIKGRKGKGRSPKEAESTTDQASQSILVTIPPIEESLDASNGDSTDINLEMPPAISATAESSNSTEAKALKIVWTDPRPPIPTLMRSLDHVSSFTIHHPLYDCLIF